MLLSDFRAFQGAQILVYAIAILGLNLLVGFNGQISLGHGAFYALGAYVAAILMDRFGVPYWATLPAAAAICLAAGFLFGLPALRLEGHYLALATFGLALSVPQLLKDHAIQRWTGGVEGITLVKPDPPAGLALSADKWLYLFVLLVTALLFAAARNLLRGRIGRALMAIRDHQVAAEAMGINAAFYKSAIFGVSAMYTGIAGALGAIIVQYVSPDSFPIFLSIFLLVGVVVGGVASLWGALVGAAFLLIAPDLAGEVSKSATGAVYGAILIVTMYRLPVGVKAQLRSLLKHRPPADHG